MNIKKFNYILFDVAPAPLILLFVGGPVLIAIAVVVLIVVAVRLIKKANDKKRAANPRAWDSEAGVDDLRKDNDPLER